MPETTTHNEDLAEVHRKSAEISAGLQHLTRDLEILIARADALENRIILIERNWE